MTDAVAAPAAERPVGVGRAHRYLPELEALRGWAMLLVYAFHLNGTVVRRSAGTADEPTPLTAFVLAGHTGVSLFFVLSAFLLALPFLAEADGGRHVSRPAYASRRALRILPLYWFAIAVATILTAERLVDLARALPYMFFLNSVTDWSTPMLPYSGAWWSLGTEAQFYLVLPLLPLLLATRAGRIAGVVLLLAWLAAYGAFLTRALRMDTLPGQVRLAYSLLGRAPLFLCGIAAAALYRRHGAAWRQRLAARPLLRRGGADAILLAVLLALGLLLQWVIVGTPTRAEAPPRHVWHVLEGALWASVVLLVLVAPLRSARLITNRATIWLGVLSYSVYIWHLPIQQFAFRWTRQLGIPLPLAWNARTIAVAAVATAACLAVSTLTYRWIERPFLTRKERVAD
ncbi:acyltransferase [bacterium]|nr:acyltransferase [bacterium]